MENKEVIVTVTVDVNGNKFDNIITLGDVNLTEGNVKGIMKETFNQIGWSFGESLKKYLKQNVS